MIKEKEKKCIENHVAAKKKKSLNIQNLIFKCRYMQLYSYNIFSSAIQTEEEKCTSNSYFFMCLNIRAKRAGNEVKDF